MTIRDFLWRRIWIGNLLWIVTTVVSWAALAAFGPAYFSSDVFVVLLILAMAVSFGVFLGRVRCPVCRYSFATQGAIKFWPKAYRINFCRHCGIALDSPHQT